MRPYSLLFSYKDKTPIFYPTYPTEGQIPRFTPHNAVG